MQSHCAASAVHASPTAKENQVGSLDLQLATPETTLEILHQFITEYRGGISIDRCFSALGSRKRCGE
ncbi:hypothetical protein DTO207G8_7979 [Paecilomyces variotii]|nr:hypothetical protein DTO207G8_7979 [Paecilomyces variotii]